MLCISNATEQRKIFRKQIPVKSSDGMVSLLLTIKEDVVFLEIRGHIRSYARNRHVGEPMLVTYTHRIYRDNSDPWTVALPVGKRVVISSVDLYDCVFDVLFDDAGFTMLLKDEIFNGVVVKNLKTNTDGWFSEVIFKSNTKSRSFILPCNPYVKMIDNV